MKMLMMYLPKLQYRRLVASIALLSILLAIPDTSAYAQNDGYTRKPFKVEFTVAAHIVEDGDYNDWNAQDEVYVIKSSSRPGSIRRPKVSRMPEEDGWSDRPEEEVGDKGYIAFKKGWEYQDIQIDGDFLWNYHRDDFANISYLLFDQDWGDDDHLGSLMVFVDWNRNVYWHGNYYNQTTGWIACTNPTTGKTHQLPYSQASYDLRTRTSHYTVTARVTWQGGLRYDQICGPLPS